MFHALATARLRSLLTALGISVGIAAVTLLTSIGEGIRVYMMDSFSQFGTRIIAITPGKTTTQGLAGLLTTIRPLSLDDARVLGQLPHVDAVVPNFLIQETIPPSLGGGFSGPPMRTGNQPIPPSMRMGLLKEPWQVVNGHIELPTKPGLGIEIDERALKTEFTYREELGGEYYYESDGSVADW